MSTAAAGMPSFPSLDMPSTNCAADGKTARGRCWKVTLLLFLKLILFCGCSIEFDTALQWRLHLRKFAAAKEQLRTSHVRELVAILADWQRVGVIQPVLARLSDFSFWYILCKLMAMLAAS